MDSTQFKAKKTVFRESHKTSKAKAKSEGGQQPGPALIDGWKCSTFQYMGNMQMRVRGMASVTALALGCLK